MRAYSSLGNLHLASSESSPSSFGHHRAALSVDDRDPMPTPNDIQSHLFSAFLSGRTADVSLHVGGGSWEGIYRLHRVVLIQAGFFLSLFDGGFREGAGRNGTPTQGEVSVIFDDPNITRAAFEVCISRLYGGGNALFVDPVLLPSRKEPLTPAFPRPLPRSNVPEGQQNATPRFLLSLLATAIYLSIPSIVSQAIQLILSSLGPHTVIRYLNFAIGHGIGEKCEHDLDAAVGLEQVCQEPPHASSIRSKSIRSTLSKHSKKNASITADDDAPAQKRPAPCNDSPSDDSDSEDLTSGQVQHDNDTGFIFMYGAASNKIGEAAACWLCRWGADMLVYEEAAESLDASADTKQEIPSVGRRWGTDSQPSAPILAGVPKEHVPHIWRRGGMNAKWVRTVLSSDAFFVRDERERYEFAKRVVELRRKVSIDPAEETEWDELFATGIHYMHMALSDLIEISQDESPPTGRLYAPVPVIQAAHWSQSVLRHHITYRQNSSLPNTPPRSPAFARDGSLGLTQTTAELREKLTDHVHGAADASKTYYPVPVDSSSRIGDTTGLEGASMDQLFNSQATPSSPAVKPGTAKGFTSYAPDTYFGILSRGREVAACLAADPGGHATWAPFPPIRFGVEFWGIDTLHEKARLTSQTIWYAGSLFNVYVQVLRKKGLQLGMYVHRLSSVETIPVPSAPPMLTIPVNEERRWSSVQPVAIPSSSSTPSLYRPNSRGTAAASAPTRADTPTSSYSPPPTAASTGTSPPHAHAGTLSTQQASRPSAQPYRDPREAVRAHFTLLCMSPTGGALTRFASAPDAFMVGRSWGWKSSALQTEELIDIHADPDNSPTYISMKKECSLRATVILGVV